MDDKEKDRKGMKKGGMKIAYMQKKKKKKSQSLS